MLGPVLIIVGLLLVPWLLYLSFRLPDTARARNWSTMWTGVDVAEAVGLIVTGVLQWRRSPRRALPAAFTSALLALDAWIDVTTSAPGHAKVLAVTLAALVEVPAAVACLILALSAFPAGTRTGPEPAKGKSPSPLVVDDAPGPRRQPAVPSPSCPDSPEPVARC